jgi:outer membrane receptor for ferrienterochelin and colicin
MLGFRTWIMVGLLGAGTLTGFSQGQLLYVVAEQKSPHAFFSELSLQTGYNIIYSDDVIQRLPDITLQMKGVTLVEILQKILPPHGLDYTATHDQIILFKSVGSTMRFNISGVVTDSISGEPLISAYIHEANSGKSTSTNNYGYFSLTLQEGPFELIAGYAGYRPARVAYHLGSNEIISIRLHSNSYLDPVIVHADMADRETTIVPRAERITLNDLQSNIHLGGSSDLYRVADFIPGIHTGTDGVGGIHVRGGANDQNLILMDGVPVYHPNHILGIVSVFNYQVLQQASIYKANFPSRFSGRLSSVMDVRTREGNIHNWGMSGNIGVSEVGLMLEGPLVDDKVGMLLSGRFFPPGLFMPGWTRQYKKQNGVGGEADLDYVDFNGKVNWLISEKDRLYLSMYHGRDVFSDITTNQRDETDPDTGSRIITDEAYGKNLNWSNLTAVLRWNHILSDHIFANIILSTSRFVLQSVDSSEFEFHYPGTPQMPVSGFDTKEFKSSIKDMTARVELDIQAASNHQFNSGFYFTRYLFQPKSITINEESKVGEFYIIEGLLRDAFFTSLEVKGIETGVYFEDKWEIDDQFRLSSGIHISGFFVQGTHYLDPQLRMSMDYLPTPKLAFNVGYSRMAQYLHNLTSSSIGLPTDLWVPTTARVSPALSDQYALSGIWKVNNHLSVDLSAYVKDMRSLISYQEGASFLLREGILPASIVDAANWESKITEGTGDAAGVELQLTYDYLNYQFKWNGTWSKTNRYFNELNDSIPFPDRYDRRWSSTFSGQIKLGARWSCGVNFLYGTGIAITLAESKFFNPSFLFPEIGINYSSRNGYRLPAYHRLDLSFNYQLSKKEKFSHSLTLNLYNVYNRINPFYITLVEDPISGDFEFRQFSLFQFFPSLSYRFALH